jgi:hypothetical protein
LKKRHRRSRHACLFGAAIPGNQDVVAQSLRRHRRRNQDRPAGLEQAGLNRGCAGPSPGTGPAQDDDVKYAAVTTDKSISIRSRIQPAERQSGVLLGRARYAVTIHKAFEQGAGLVRHLDVILSDLDRQRPSVIQRKKLDYGRGQRETLDVTVEPLGKQQRRLQRRNHKVMLLGRNENGLHARGLQRPLLCADIPR